MSNSLDSDQAQHLVGPDLDPNCLHLFTADFILQVKIIVSESSFLKSGVK